MSENYFADLADVPDEIGRQMVADVGKHFDERPSVKNLLDWARSLGPHKLFDIQQLDAPGAAHVYRPSSTATPGQAALAVIGAEKTRVPESARAIIREMEARHKAEQHRSHASPNALLPTGNFGLEYQYPDGKIERFPARHSEADARARCDEACRKYSHFQCRVYQKSAPTV